MVTDQDLILMAGTALIVGAPLVTWGLGKLPGTRIWIEKEAIKGYNWLDKIKPDVPAAGLPLWQAAYDALDAVIDAFGDDEITPKELRHMATHAFGLVWEARKLVM